MTSKRGARKQTIRKGDRGPGAKRTRPARMNNMPVDDDEQTRIEAEIAGSGRTELRPREGLAGAHTVRRQPRSAPLERGQRSFGDEPMGAGSEVAPTRLAAQRERERHRLQRQEGVVPAGEDGNLRQRRGPRATRASLDAAARAADKGAPSQRRATRR
jgi:hypothetical protein